MLPPPPGANTRSKYHGENRVKLQSIDGLFESRKFEKLMEAIPLSVY